MSLVPVPVPNLQEDRHEILERVLLNGVSNENTERAYRRALEKFLAWYDARGYREISRHVLEQYRAESKASGAAASSTNLELAALRRVFRRAADAGLVDHEKAEDAAQVKNARSNGVRAGNWLTPEQARALLLAPDENTLKGKRDGAILGFLVGCGLRRAELVSLVVDHVQMREDRWVIPELIGKGDRVRLVPIPAWVKDRLDLWMGAAKITKEKIFRAVGKNGKVSGASLSTTAVWKIVLQYARQVGIERLAPHDLRRTCAKLCRKSGGDLEQIQFLLGHASIQTTEKYLGGEQDIVNAVNDRIFGRVKRFQSNSD
ncbi:MAG: tyrosine-type recombinase/integrase [Thiobacillaceae bacterium]